MIEPPRQKLTATNSNLTISESENEHTDNSETLKQKYHIKKIVSMLRIFHYLSLANCQLSQREHQM